MTSRPPTHDDALVSELGIFVVVAIMRENEPDVKRRAHTVRNKGRKALGISGPRPKMRTVPPAMAAKPPKTRKRHPRVLVAGEGLGPQRGPVEEPARAVRPQHVPGEVLCHACLREDAEQRDRFAKRLADQRNHVAATREASEADRLRSLILVSGNRKCRFHSGAPRTRREIPEPTVRPPGIAEMEGAL